MPPSQHDNHVKVPGTMAAAIDLLETEIFDDTPFTQDKADVLMASLKAFRRLAGKELKPRNWPTWNGTRREATALKLLIQCKVAENSTPQLLIETIDAASKVSSDEDNWLLLSLALESRACPELIDFLSQRHGVRKGDVSMLVFAIASDHNSRIIQRDTYSPEIGLRLLKSFLEMNPEALPGNDLLLAMLRDGMNTALILPFLSKAILQKSRELVHNQRITVQQAVALAEGFDNLKEYNSALAFASLDQSTIAIFEGLHQRASSSLETLAIKLHV